MLLEDLLEHFRQAPQKINVFDESAFMEDVFEYDDAVEKYGTRWVKEWEYICSNNTLLVTLS